MTRDPGSMRDNRSYWAESRAQESIVGFLRRSMPSHYRIVAVPNGRFKADPKTVARLKREGLSPGFPDLLVLRNDGWFASIEVKAPGGRLSPEQVEWSDWLAAGGASQAIVRGLDEVEEAMRVWHVPLRARVAV